MSYASGFMVGTSIGQAVYKMFRKNGKAAAAATPGGLGYHGPVRAQQPLKPSQPQAQAAPESNQEEKVPRFSCVSVLKGRRRYRVQDLVGNNKLANLLTEELGKLPGIRSIVINTLTGSILVYSYSEAVLDKLENFLRFRLFPSLVTGLVSVVNDVEEEKKEVTTYIKAVHNTVSLFNEFIFKKTKALFDLRTLTAFLLTLRGLRKVVFMGQRPSGPQMLWWALSLLRGKK